MHEGIIDLYLQVKIRSNDEVSPLKADRAQIDMFESDQLTKERERLSKLDSLTVLDYIRTSIEILMQMKFDDDKEGSGKEKERGFGNEGAQSDFTSTFQSLDLPPKEYEQQLQQYESEVRNHIKVEQQLKLHIEVLQEKIDDLEKERDKFEKRLQSEMSGLEKKLKEGYGKLLEAKTQEAEKISKELKKTREYVNASLERGRGTGQTEKHSTS